MQASGDESDEAAVRIVEAPTRGDVRIAETFQDGLGTHTACVSSHAG